MSIETDLITISDKVTKIANYVENLTTLFMEDNATNADWILLKADLQDYASNIDNVKSGILTVANGGTGQTSIAEIQAGKDGNGNTITTTYATKTELSNLSKGLIQVVSELPTTGSEGIIYLVKSASDSDTFDKYTWENNAFLNLGTTVIDLTSYVQKANAISDLSINGKVITYIKADGSTGTLTTQDTNTTYNVVSTTANGLMSKDDKSKLDGIAAGAQVNTITGVKGNSESTYRTGNINITAANVGAATSSHTHSANDINSGTLSTDRIPDLAAGKITSGTFNAARIPNLDASKITSGTIDIARLPAAALERLVTVTDATARKKLTTSSVQVGDTVKETSTGKMYRVIDDTKLTSDDGYVEYTVGSAASVPWNGITGKPSSYYTHPSATAYNSGLYKITVNNLGHVTAATAVTKTDITDLGIPSTNTTYSAATQSANGLMSAADKKKLDGIASGANNYTYTLPTASSTLGGVKTTSTVTSTSGLTACPIIDGIPYYKDTNTTYSLSSLGIGNVKNYDQSKAIKAITRNGTTFTYTCLDGTTGTFTQQDNNTTYSNFVKSGSTAAAGLVPSPGTTAGTTKYLREDGTWQVPPNTNTWTAFKGCSSSAAGTAGYVPAPAKGDQAKFFRADGTWVVPTNTTYSNMTAATASAAGKAGLVPAPAAGTQGKFLRGDGTWQTPTNTWTAMVGATSSANGTAGYVPAPPTSGYNTKYLRADGTWQVPPDNNTVYTHPTTSGNKHIPSGGKNGQFLGWSADGTAQWVNNPNTNTTYTFATGDNNGQIKVTPSGGTASNISVKGLGSAAYTASTAYAAASHTHSYLPLSGGKVTGTIIKIASNIDITDAITNTFLENWCYSMTDKNNVQIGGIAISRNPSINSNRILIRISNRANKWAEFRLQLTDTNIFSLVPSWASGVQWEGWGGNLPVQGNVYPSVDNTYTLGLADNKRWKVIYANTATISTSDQRLKQNIQNLPDKVLDAWSEVNFIEFKFKDAVKEKGEGTARKHCGLIAQGIQTVFTKYNLDAREYGLFCYDEYEAYDIEHKVVDKEAVYDNEGNEIESEQVHYEIEHKEAGNVYSLRYEEVLCMEAAYQRRRADRLEARLKALEDKLASM